MKCIIIIFLLFISCLEAQLSDAQWYIRQGKYGPNAATVSNITLNSSNNLYIYNVQAPGADPFIAGESKNTKNDLFIIFKNGEYFNSTDFFKLQGNIDFNDQFSIGTNFNYSIQLYGMYSDLTTPLISDIKYLYYSNIYEDDDPSASVQIRQIPVLGQPLTNNINIDQYNQNSNILSSNHTVVKGKDYTLIIPKNWDCDTIAIKYASDLFSFDKLLNPIGIATATANLPGSLIIENAFDNNNKFNFVNFNTASNSTYSSNNFTIYVGCYQGSNKPIKDAQVLTQSIDTAHDPNYIMVKCIEKKGKDPNAYYLVRYHVEFENDGLAPVHTCELSFELPPTVIPSSLMVKNWYYGGQSGCYNSPPMFSKNVSTIPPNYRFVFNDDIDSPYQLEAVTSPVSSRRAFVEFCVRLRSDTLINPQNCDLRLTNCLTYFGATPYNIDRFIDRGANNILWPNPNISRKPVKYCCIDCAVALNK